VLFIGYREGIIADVLGGLGLERGWEKGVAGPLLS